MRYMMKPRLVVVCVLVVLCASSVQGEENIRRISTWNMKWLGTSSGNQLDPVENVPDYAAYIRQTQATLFALQEIGGTHSENGEPKCHFLDLIVDELNADADESMQWTYILDDRNGNQRLAFLYREDHWRLTNSRTVWPGQSFRGIRRPFLVSVEASGNNASLKFDFINIHLKAMPDSGSKRAENIEDLSIWLETATLDDDVLVAGDTNIYFGESDVDDPMGDIGYRYLYDAERTSIHDDVLSQRFDRFFCSPDLYNEIRSAKDKVGSKDYIDVVKDNDPESIRSFDENISDHFAVVLNVDVSQER